MKYKNKGYCECCNELTWVRSDKLQGVVCKACDEPTLSFKQERKTNHHSDCESFELYPRLRKAM
jgi:ssDNA-binding Zn-finger/Zn-ribbon topoisomerase 1